MRTINSLPVYKAQDSSTGLHYSDLCTSVNVCKQSWGDASVWFLRIRPGWEYRRYLILQVSMLSVCLMVKQHISVTDDPVSLRFPLQEEHRRHWLVNMRRDAEWTPSESSSLCSAHFTPDCFESGSARLHSDAIPTIFNFTQSTVSLSIYLWRPYFGIGLIE